MVAFDSVHVPWWELVYEGIIIAPFLAWIWCCITDALTASKPQRAPQTWKDLSPRDERAGYVTAKLEKIERAQRL